MKNLLLVDGTNLFISRFGVYPTIHPSGVSFGGVWGFLEGLSKAISKFGIYKVIIAFDGRGGSWKRKEMFPDYKKNRYNRIKINRPEGYKEDIDKAIEWQMEVLVHEYLYNLPVTVLIQDHIEADDTIATLVYSKRYDFVDYDTTYIMSSDKDFYQLISEDVKVYNFFLKKVFDRRSFFGKFKMLPENYIYYKCFVGDYGDNVPTFPGIGEKTTFKYFPEISSKIIEDLEWFKTRAEELNEERIKSKKKPYLGLVNLTEQFDKFQLNYDLMQLREPDLNNGVLTKYANYFHEVDFDHLKKRYVHDGLHFHLRFNDFYKPFINLK